MFIWYKWRSPRLEPTWHTYKVQICTKFLWKEKVNSTLLLFERISMQNIRSSTFQTFSLLEMEEELVCPVPGQPEWHCPPRVLRLTNGWGVRLGRGQRERVQRENQEAGQEDHPPVRVHLYPACGDRDLPQGQHGSLLRGDQWQDARFRCRAQRRNGLDGDYVRHRIPGILTLVHLYYGKQKLRSWYNNHSDSCVSIRVFSFSSTFLSLVFVCQFVFFCQLLFSIALKLEINKNQPFNYSLNKCQTSCVRKTFPKCPTLP